jgi:hypothetical protein
MPLVLMARSQFSAHCQCRGPGPARSESRATGNLNGGPGYRDGHESLTGVAAAWVRAWARAGGPRAGNLNLMMASLLVTELGPGH